LSLRGRGDERRAADPSSVIPDTFSLEEMEKRHIEQVLRKNNFSRTRTADDLGISKKTLYLKIKRYGIPA
jgi:transcriptional regulator with PAS, ATPase and Fis domain